MLTTYTEPNTADNRSSMIEKLRNSNMPGALRTFQKIPFTQELPEPDDERNYENSFTDEGYDNNWSTTVGTYSELHPAAEKVVHYVFHGGCSDGFTAAWAYYRSLKANPPKEPTKVIFTPETHKWVKTQALLERASLKNETVYFVDICPPRKMCEQLHAKAGKLQIYDHHKTAMEDAGDLPYCYFDMKRSGAGIAWDVFNPDTKRPLLVDCVEDRDIWKWTVPNSKDILAVMFVTTRLKFEALDAFHSRLEKDVEAVIREGKLYNRYKDIVVQMITGRKVHKLTIKGLTMPAVNACIMQSEVGHVLTEKIGPCAAVYYWNGQYWAFSLRSDDKGPDVGEIARKLSGGGHRNAAGFRVDNLSELKQFGFEFESYTEDEQDELEYLLSPTQVEMSLDNYEMRLGG